MQAARVRCVCAVRARVSVCALGESLGQIRFGQFTVAVGGLINFRVNVESHEYINIPAIALFGSRPAICNSQLATPA